MIFSLFVSVLENLIARNFLEESVSDKKNHKKILHQFYKSNNLHAPTKCSIDFYHLNNMWQILKCAVLLNVFVYYSVKIRLHLKAFHFTA